MTRLAGRLRELGGFAGADIAMLLPNQAACVMKALQRKHAGHGGDRRAAVLERRIFYEDGYSGAAGRAWTIGITAGRCSLTLA